MSFTTKTNRKILENLRFQDVLKLEHDRLLNHNKLSRIERQLLIGPKNFNNYVIKTPETVRNCVNKDIDVSVNKHVTNSANTLLPLNHTYDSINSNNQINLNHSTKSSYTSCNREHNKNGRKSVGIMNLLKKDKENNHHHNHDSYHKQEKLITHHRVDIPISYYPLNQDTNPILINKKPSQNLEYKQEIFYRFLQPPTPPLPGDIIIQEEPSKTPDPPPALILRQIPKKNNNSMNPKPIIIREMPPPHLLNPPSFDGKVIKIKSKNSPSQPPSRKIIIERYEPTPAKPAPIILERWLPCDRIKGKIIFERSHSSSSIAHEKSEKLNCFNKITQVDKQNDFVQYKNTNKTDPVDYLNNYGPNLIGKKKLPVYISKIMPPTDKAKTQILCLNSKNDDNNSNFNDISKRASFRRSQQTKQTINTFTSSSSSIRTNNTGVKSKITGQRSKSASNVYEKNRNHINRHIQELEYIVKSSFGNSNKFDTTTYSIIEKMFTSVIKNMKSNEYLSVEETLRVLFEIKRLLGSPTMEEYLNLIFYKLKPLMQSKIDANDFKRVFKNYLD